MGRSGYSDDCDNDWQMIMYRGAVASAFRGRRGQAFLKEMLAALDALPEPKLIAGELVEQDGAVCAMGAVAKARGIDVTGVHPENIETVAAMMNVAEAMAREIAWENDQDWSYTNETPEARFQRMRAWVVSEIKE